MKKTIYTLIAGLTGLFSLASCSDWLDVAPNTDLPAKELFTTENGFKNALAGLYISMTDENTYGKNLTFGLMDQLAQMYDKLPEGTTDRNSVYIYDRETSGAYNTKGTLASIWGSQYNTIANANNLLKWWNLNGEAVIVDSITRRMIRGEALAIRAFLHFDLLRGWGPANYAGNESVREMKCIPYRTVADHSKQPQLPASEVLANIISDLKEARECLDYEKELDLSDRIEGRHMRFNYHAINALLARVYNYAGEKDSAALHALKVIEECGLSLESGNDNDPILSKEVIVGLNMHELEDNLSDYFAVSDKLATKYYLNISTLNIIFESVGSESEDIRAKGTAFYRNNEQQNAISLKYVDNDNEIIPLIRLSEMYYIACEAVEDGVDAARYVNLVRNKRGISKAKNVSCDTDELRVAALNKEYRKEFYGEGQYFWFLKTHGITGALAHCAESVIAEENFLFPLPDAEIEFGWAEEENPVE
ncbi:MAG: RagB/SusD family nutrient uptake outer membrane protein [Bacteroidaceae bacterium]|nr:RagB/SusD family nutrient uptake outer membrane protein [Bacteroidaceae bacterium]